MVRSSVKSFYSLAARLSLPRYHWTLLWSRSLGPVRGNMRAWPYWRSVELALLGLQRRYDATFPDADSYSLVELGVWRGDSLELLVHYRDTLVRRLGVTKPIVVYGFDTFEGLPAARVGDEALPWEKGQFAADYQTVVARFAAHANVKLVKGLFADTLARYRDELRQSPPVRIGRL